ncbi:hypothetical protein [Phenylobacterium sp.]|uniref:hypothetical protein n=1 Tax=Phenylobacterium sp. TaxID=1871053 RepID=UPI0030F457BA
MRLRSAPLWIAGSLTAVTGLLALLHLSALITGGEVSLGSWRLAAVGAGYTRKAEDLVSTRSATAGDLAKAEQLSGLALREFPYDTSSWIRLAYIDHLRHGDPSPIGLRAFERSYDLVAIDPQFGPWRIHFALERWDKLPNNLKKAVRGEAEALSTEGRSRAKLQAALAAVKNPDSTVLATLWRQRYVINASRIEHRSPEKRASQVGY